MFFSTFLCSEYQFTRIYLSDNSILLSRGSRIHNVFLFYFSLSVAESTYLNILCMELICCFFCFSLTLSFHPTPNPTSPYRIAPTRNLQKCVRFSHLFAQLQIDTPPPWCWMLDRKICHFWNFAYRPFVRYSNPKTSPLSSPAHPVFPLPPWSWQNILGPEAKAVYSQLVEQPVEANPLRMLRSVPLVRPKLRGNKHQIGKTTG